MDELIKARVIKGALLLIENNSNVRVVAKQLGYSKSTIHNDLSKRLKLIDLDLYEKVNKVFQINKEECHIRGGLQTKLKYQKIK